MIPANEAYKICETILKVEHWMEETVDPIIRKSANNKLSSTTIECPTDFMWIAIEKFKNLGYEVKNLEADTGAFDIPGNDKIVWIEISWENE